MQKISIANKEYNLRITHSKRARYLRVQVSEQGLEVILPQGVAVSEAEKFLFRNRVWIEKHIGKYNHTSPGEYFYLGNKVKIEHKLDPKVKNIRVETVSTTELSITSSPDRSFSIRAVYNLWLRNQAKLVIPERVKYLARKHDFSIGTISIRNQKTRWGSCSGKGNLSFNSKLMMFEPDVIDYVIIHELCHLKEMNHSKKFWASVEKIVPGYKEQKKKLRKNILK